LTLALREVDVQAHQDGLVDLLARHFDGWGSEAAGKFRWLYLTNPFGRARAWALESGSDRFVGVSAAFPRRLRAGSRPLEAWVLGDFCVDQKHRSLGPALQLQRAVSAAVDRGEVDAWYDFPSRTMQAVYGRMGLSAAGEIVRLVYPLRVDGAVERRLDNPVLAKGLSAVGNAVLGTRDALRRRDATVDVRPFDDAFESSLEPGHGVQDGVWLERTPAYLLWRYRRDPRGPSSILSAWRGGACGGFAVFRAHPEHHAIVDAFGIREEAFLRELVLEVVDRARKASASSVTASVSSRHPWIGTFESLGFHRREGAPYFFYAKPGAVPEGAPWFLTSGDRDL
jgi:GNAT superfamily N-acetyltransferase